MTGILFLPFLAKYHTARGNKISKTKFAVRFIGENMVMERGITPVLVIKK